MSLKAAMAADLDVFFNLNEHAQEVQVDNGDGAGDRTLIVILSEAEFELYDGKQMGAVQDGITMRCKSTDLDRPSPSQRLIIDGKEWTVIKAAESMGMLAIDLVRYEPWRA